MNTNNGKWRALLQVILLGGFASLGACGKDDGTSDVPSFNNPNATMTIENFGVTGNATVVNGVVQIVPKSSTNTNGGLFTISWTITGNDTYTARVYVSSNNVLDSTDIKILEGCGKQSTTDICRSNALPVCTFENTNVNTNIISCSTPLGNQIADVTRIIPIATPRTSVLANIVMEACNPNGTCFSTTTAQAIQVRFQ